MVGLGSRLGEKVAVRTDPDLHETVLNHAGNTRAMPKQREPEDSCQPALIYPAHKFNLPFSDNSGD
jgi:hypothetical protein